MHSNNMSRRSFLKLTGSMAAVAGLGLVGCSGGGSTASTSASSTAAASQVGGKLTMYTPNSEGLVNNLVPAFEDATGITVDLIQAGTGELFKKLESEKGNPVADVIWGGAYTKYWSSAELFETYTAADNNGVIED